MSDTHRPYDCCNVTARPLSRRHALETLTAGFGWLAMSSLMADDPLVIKARTDSLNPLAPKQPHFPAKAKRVIFLCMQGAPSHMDTFDYKPKLNEDAKKAGSRLVPSPYPFKQHGQSGLWISDLFPNISKHADELCLLRSMNTDIPNHAQGFTMLHTGNTNFVRPSLGSWVLYGLGKECDDLPGFISLSPPLGNAGVFGSAFLPAIYQGMHIGALKETEEALNGNAVHDIKNPLLNPELQRKQIDIIQAMNDDLLKSTGGNQEVEGVIQSYEQAFKMQSSVPRVMDISKESKATLDLYGVDSAPTDAFARQCLLARRFVESGVRFVEVTHGGWDHHSGLKARLGKGSAEIDKPIAGLLNDLAARGMLKDTLVIWGGEFGRTPDGRSGDGRNHNAKGYTMWMAGGGVKGGMSYGATDDHGQAAVEKPMHVHDLHATILHALGLNHEQLTYQYAGRPFRLTNVMGKVAKEIFA